MGVFKDYFFKTLRWPLSHHPGALAVIVEGLAKSMDQVRGDIIHLRNQFNPWTCEPDMIAKHAASRGIRQHASESDEQFRARCVRAYAWQRLGGGQLGMPQILAHFGYSDTSMINVREEDPQRWAEFKPRVPVKSGMEAEDFRTIGWVAVETKPARSRVAGIRAASTVAGSVNAGGITFSSIRIRLTPERTTNIQLTGSVYGGAYSHVVARTRA